MKLADRVQRHRLDNGLGILILPDRSAPVVAYQTWFRVGSRHEREGKTGIAHLFEHLMFNQTEHLAAGEFDRRMEAAGGETNAATWVDWTFYTDSLPAARLELAVALEAERMSCLTLTETQVESEREVVANERRYRVDDDVEGFLSEELYRLALGGHPYGWPTIGWMRDIMALTVEDCRAFYRTWYAPNNATVVVVGDVDPAATLALIERHYGRIRPQPVAADPPPEAPPQREERRARFEKPVPADRAIFAWRAPPQGHPDWLALQLVHAILCGGPSSRLYRRAVIEREVCSSLVGMLTPFAGPGLYELVGSMVRGKTAADLEALVDEEVARLQAEPPDATELGKAKTRIETDFWSELETAEGKAEALGHHETALGDYARLFEAQARLPALGPDDVARAAASWLVRERRTIVVAVPSGEEPGA